MEKLTNIIGGYKILTLTYREVPTHQLEQLVVSGADQKAVFQSIHQIKEDLNISEVFYLNTCNRVLFFCYTEQEFDLTFQMRLFRKINPNLSADQAEGLANHVRILEGEDCLEHIFEIAASIDSMVVGEREILRQVRTAYEECAMARLTGDYLRMAMQLAVRSAKDVYHNTKIGDKPISIVSLSIKALLLRKPKVNSRILLVGAGQTMMLVSKFLKKHEFHNVVVFNRTIEKAESIATFLGGQAKNIDELANYKGGFDIMITCTGNAKSWIDESIYRGLCVEDQQEKIVIDLAVPTNMKQEVIKSCNIDYIQVEDLRKTAKENLAFREKEVAKAKVLLDHHITEFKTTLRQRKLERALKDVPFEIKQIKHKAIKEVFAKDLAGLDGESRALVLKMMDYMEKKCISVPMKAAKKAVFH